MVNAPGGADSLPPVWGPPVVNADRKRYSHIYTAARIGQFVARLATAWWWLTLLPLVAVSAMAVVATVAVVDSWLVPVIVVAALVPTACVGRAAVAAVRRSADGNGAGRATWRTVLEETRQRHLDAVERFRWPRLMSRAAMVLLVDRRARSPRLVETSYGPGWLQPTARRLVIEPLAPQDVVTWPLIEERLARVTRSASSAMAVDPARKSVMILRLGRQAMPARIELDAEQLVASVSNDLTKGPGYQIGVAQDGTSVVWRPGESGRQGLLITGTAGAGKTSTAHSLIAQAGLNGELVVILDGKAEGEFDWASGFASMPSTRAGMFAAIGFVYAEMLRRQAAVKALGYGGRLNQMPRDLAASHGLAQRLMLFAEELTTLVTFLRSDPQHAAIADPKLSRAAGQQAERDWKLAMGQLAEIARLGRSTRISVVASVQHAVADNLGPNQFGSTIMSVLNARVGIGRMEREVLQRLFPSSTPAAREALQVLEPGRSIVAGLSSDTGNEAQLARMHLVPHDQLELACLRLADDVPDFDEIPTTSAEELTDV